MSNEKSVETTIDFVKLQSIERISHTYKISLIKSINSTQIEILTKINIYQQ